MDKDLATRVSTVLSRYETGDPCSLEDLFPLVYDDLRGFARGLLSRERSGHTLQATALVNEAYLKLVDASGLDLRDEVHLQAVAARAMRRILIDHARGKKALKRGGAGLQLVFDENIDAAAKGSALNLLELNDALEALGRLDERKGRVAELRLFGSMTFPAMAKVLGVSHTTVESDWYLARAWLRSELRKG